MAKRDNGAIRRHAERTRARLFERIDRNRALYADVNREFYPLGVAGWTREAEDLADRELYDEDHRLLTDMPLICQRKAASGFNANLTSPARPWFRLKNPSFREDATVRERNALDVVARAAAEVMSRSNTYKALSKLYDHLIVNGFACMLVTRDEKTVVNVRTLRPGTYALGVGADGIVNRCARRFAWTAEQIVGAFGEDAVPDRVRAAYGHIDRLFTVYNLIEPHAASRSDRLAGKTGLAENFPYRSFYWLKGARDDDPQGGVLEVAGFAVKPIIAPRFDYELGDVYGRSPCLDALDLARGVQTFRYDVLNISGLRARPPLVVSADFKDEGFDAGRGGINYARFGDQNRQACAPVFQVPPDANDARLSMSEAVDELKTILFVSAFQTIDSLKNNRGVKTATEVDALVRENMEMLGPVVMNLDRELLDPLVTAVVSYCLDSGRLQLDEGEMAMFDGAEIEYISQVHVAAKQSQISALRDNAQLVLSLSQTYPAARHRLDVDRTIDTYADLTGCPAAIFADEKTVGEARAADAKAEAQQRQMAAMESLGKTAGAVGGMPTDEAHAGSKLVEALAGGGAA